MRILLILIFAVFSLGAMATYDRSGMAPAASGTTVTLAQAGTLTGAVAVVRKIKSHLSSSHSAQDSTGSAVGREDISSLDIGDALPEGTELYKVPKHESYRYAVVQGHRVIVDAASRQIVYIIR